VILTCITVLSCVSSYKIYQGGFSDVPSPAQQILALFAVIVVEGAFVWLVYGFTRAFSSALERLICMGCLGGDYGLQRRADDRVTNYAGRPCRPVNPARTSLSRPPGRN
jgi:hypothetical protein